MDKWKFCENQICPYCKRELEDEDYLDEEREVTSCVFCNHSFVE